MGKEKRRIRNGSAGEYGPRGFEKSFIFSSFWIKFEFKSNSIKSYMNSNAKHSTIQNKMQATWNTPSKYIKPKLI
jgi:hypothetical protein